MASRSRQDRTGRRRNRRYLVLTVMVLALAGGWIALWNYAATKAENSLAGWRAREARSGRDYACGRQTIGGFPFRIEVHCDRASALLRGSQPPVEIKAANIHVVAQIYQPNLLISEYAGPLTVGEPGRPPSITANWELAQSSVRGTPAAPERVSFAVDAPVLERANSDGALLRAKRIEAHGRIADGSASNRPVIDLVLRLEQFSAPAAGPLTAVPIDADVSATVRGLNDFSPKSWAARFREIQAGGGRIDITQARARQGETLAVGSGSLTINAQGRLDGQLNLAVAGVESFINALAAANQQRSGFGFTLGLGLLGGNAKVEGRPAIALPLRVTDGTVFFGPLQVAEIPPLF